ncbi:MAG: hypothetical protein AB7F40_05640 [Victivallaceae bacterium]
MNKYLERGCALAAIALAGLALAGCALPDGDTLAALKQKAVAELKTAGPAKAKDLVEQAVADGKITRAQADLLNQAIADGAAKLENLNVEE